MCTSGAQCHGNQREERERHSQTQTQRDGHGRLHSQPDGHAAGLPANKQVREHDSRSGWCGEGGGEHGETAGFVGADAEQNFLICTHFSPRELLVARFIMSEYTPFFNVHFCMLLSYGYFLLMRHIVVIVISK